MLISERMRRQEDCLGRNPGEGQGAAAWWREERLLRKREEKSPPITGPKEIKTSCVSEVRAKKKKPGRAFLDLKRDCGADKPKGLDAVS